MMHEMAGALETLPPNKRQMIKKSGTTADAFLGCGSAPRVAAREHPHGINIALRMSVPFDGLAATNMHRGGIVPCRIARVARDQHWRSRKRN